TEVEGRHAKQHDERERPEPHRAVQIPRQTLPSYATMDHQAATPSPDAGPPDHQSREAKHEQTDRADAVDLAACGSGQQVVVQIDRRRHEPDTSRHRVAQIAPGPRIKQPALDVSSALERNVHRLIGVACSTQAGHPITPVDAQRSFLQLIVAQARRGTLRDEWFGCGQHEKAVAVDEHAAGHADHHDVRADTNAAPQVYLEQGPSDPQGLGLTNPALPSAQFQRVHRPGSLRPATQAVKRSTDRLSRLVRNVPTLNSLEMSPAYEYDDACGSGASRA